MLLSHKLCQICKELFLKDLWLEFCEAVSEFEQFGVRGWTNFWNDEFGTPVTERSRSAGVPNSSFQKFITQKINGMPSGLPDAHFCFRS